MANKEQADALVAKGFDVFPITAGAKAPPIVAGWPHLAGKETGYWAGSENFNIGIHCKGLVVVDVDVKKGGRESFKQLDEMLEFTPTLTSRTPSGGYHVFYRLPDGHPGVPNSVEVLGKGLDIRSTNGYVVAPGSVTEAGEYTFTDDGWETPQPAPDWLVRKLGVFTKREQPINMNVPDGPLATWAQAAEWLWTAERSVKGAGGDQAAYRVACRLRDLGMSYLQACELMRSEAWDYGCGWRQGRLEEKPIASAYRYAQNEDGGGRGVVEDDLPAPQPDAPVPAKPKKRTKVQHAEEMVDEETTDDYLAKGWLDRASYAELFGAPGEGKTFVALDIAYHVAARKRWMDCNVRGGLVLYLAFEGKGGIRKRLKAIRKKHGALGDLYIVNAAMNLRDVAGRNELGQIIADLPSKPVLVVIDTLARALMGADENSAQDIGAFNNAVEGLIDHTGACVLVIHHSGKNKSAGARGSSAIQGAIDTELEIDNKQILSRKQREGDNPDPKGFKLVPLDLYTDSDGDWVSSCVVEPASVGPAGNKPLSAKGEHAFGILSEMTGPENKPVSRSLFVRKMIDEGIGRSAAHDWVRKLKLFNKATIEDDMITRRLA